MDVSNSRLSGITGRLGGKFVLQAGGSNLGGDWKNINASGENTIFQSATTRTMKVRIPKNSAQRRCIRLSVTQP